MKNFKLYFVGLMAIQVIAFAEVPVEIPAKEEVTPTSTKPAQLPSPAVSERDPFASGLDDITVNPVVPIIAEAAVVEQNMVLEGVAIGPTAATAVINRKTYAKGKLKDGIEVIEVRNREADIKVNGVLRTLSFPVSKVKKTKSETAMSSNSELDSSESGASTQEAPALEEVSTSQEDSK